MDDVKATTRGEWVAIVSTIVLVAGASLVFIPGLDGAEIEAADLAEAMPRLLPSLGTYVLLQLVSMSVARDLRRVLAVLYVLLSAMSGFAIALWLERSSEEGLLMPFVNEPGLLFRVTTMLTFGACAAMIWWLGEWVTAASSRVTGPLLVVAVAQLVELPPRLVAGGRALALEETWHEVAAVVAPMCVGLALLIIGPRAKGAFPIAVGPRGVLRSSFDVACLPLLAAYVGAPVAWIVARSPFPIEPGVIAAVTALALACVASIGVIRHARTRGRSSPRTILAGALVLLVAPTPFLVAFVDAGGITRLTTGPLTGTSRYTLVLEGSSPSPEQDAAAMVERIDALGASASVVSVTRDRITLDVSDAVPRGALMPSLASPELAFRIVEAESEQGDCESVRAFVAARRDPRFVFAVSRRDAHACVAMALSREAIVTDADVVSASVTHDRYDEPGRPVVAVVFSDAGAARFERDTGANVGRLLAIVIDGEVLSAPTIAERISGGHAQITLGLENDGEASAQALATALTPGMRTRGTWTLAGVR